MTGPIKKTDPVISAGGASVPAGEAKGAKGTSYTDAEFIKKNFEAMNAFTKSFEALKASRVAAEAAKKK